MFTLPPEFAIFVVAFEPLFSNSIWPQARVLFIGAILATGKRTVTAVLRIMGLSADKHFQNYHRVLNRAVWSSLAAARILLALLVAAFVPSGPIVMGLDDTLERRRGAKIKAKGIYRDPVRSSHSHFVKASGLRWLNLMLLVTIPWAKRIWALPFLTALAPSERYSKTYKRQHKKLTDWAWSRKAGLLQARRWLRRRKLVVVADSSFAAISLLFNAQQLTEPICMITRLRLDAALYEPAVPRKPGQMGRTRVKGKRLPTLEEILKNPKTKWTRVTLPQWYGEGRRVIEIASATAVWYHSGQPALPMRWVLIRDPKNKFEPQALLCTDLTIQPLQIVKWFVMRWRLEVTFEEVRAHLGFETQRQWSDLAIARSTPAILGLFSLVTLLAHQLAKDGKLPVRQDAWYQKSLPTFSDALAVVRQHLWQQMGFQTSPSQVDRQKVPNILLQRMAEALCYTT